MTETVPTFIHLHTHSYYSFLEGLFSPGELAQTAAKHGMPAVALTDHNSMTGAVEFYDACRGLGVQPILGLELDVSPPTDSPIVFTKACKLVLLARDLPGWSNLCSLGSQIQTDLSGGASTSISFENLSEYSGGLICLTGSRRELLAQLVATGQTRAAEAYLHHLKDLFPNNLYVEVQSQGTQDRGWLDRSVDLAKRLHVPFVATQDVYYKAPEQAELQILLAAIRLNRPLYELSEADIAPVGSFFSGQEEMSRRFLDFPEALSASAQISELCRLDLPVGVSHYPEIPLQPGQTAIQVLRQKAEDGASRLYGSISTEIQAQLDHEISVIDECGYTALFLIMEDIIRHAKSIGVPVSSRGSAASSLVAHCLGITSPDPIRLNLYFERFLNPARATPPDIDTDLCSRRRDNVIRYVYERYGAERVAMVCTVNRFRRRSALRETAKAFGLASSEIRNLTERLPHRNYGPPGRDPQPGGPYGELAEQYQSPLHQTIFQEAEKLLGLPRHLSVHPGGVVIAPGKMTDLVPTQRAAKGVIITQFDLDSIERMGLVKIDLLGIRGLTVLGDVAESILRERTRVSASSAGQNEDILEILEAIPEDDPATADLVRTGNTIGCFQIESPGMRATLKEIHASSVEDILVALALYRPGPLTGGLKDDFVRRHRREEQTEYLHPALEPLLADTYGVILYQEQVLRIANGLAGMSLADGDLLRRAMSHFDPGKQMQTLKDHFIEGAAAHSGVPAETAERIWELMAAFAGYGFPKAHAASYAQVAWRGAWCKAHYPAVFMAAVLANWGGYYSQRVYLTEARRMGLAIRPPHVNCSLKEFSVLPVKGEEVLFMGLNQVRELTRRTQTRIIHERPFRSFRDFLARVDPRPLEAENLIRVGGLEGFGKIPGLLTQLKGGGWKGGQLPLFEFEASSDRSQEDWSLRDKLIAQEEILGASVDAHPLELFVKQIADSGAISTVGAAARIGEQVRVAGTRQTWRRSLTVRGQAMYFMSLEDLDGMLDVVIFPDVYRRCQKELHGPGPYIVEGIIEMDELRGEPSIRATKIWRLVHT
jgi:DNA polymerase-3 subunit alpha